jgi:O-antigen ligase
MMAKSAEKRPIPLRAWPVAAFFAITPALTVGGAMALPALQALTGLGAARWRGLLPRSVSAWVFVAAFAAFLAWTSASALWSPYPNHSQVLRLLGGVACGLFLVTGAGADPASRRLARAAGIACVAVLAGLMLVEAFADLPLNRLGQPTTETGLLERNPGRGAVVLVMMAWGMLGALAGGSSFERMAWRVLLLAVGTACLQFHMDANALAFVIGLIGYSAGRMAPRFALISMSALLAAWLLAMPWLVGPLFSNQALVDKLPLSWMHRTLIWNFTAAKIQEKPLFGWGLDASRTFGETKVVNDVTYNLMPLHPHSGSMHVWLETGAVGAALAAIAIVAGGVALANALKQQPATAGAACGVIGVCAVMYNVSFGAWQEWLVAATFAGAAMVAATYRKAQPPAPEAPY